MAKQKKAISFQVPLEEYNSWKQYADRQKPQKLMTMLIREAVAEKIQRETPVVATLNEL